MAIQTEPTRIQIPFADSGTKNTIPATNSTPSASQAASWTDGFPTQCSLPLASGGIPPARADFNGIFNTMSQSIRFGQEGGVWAWDATVDYAANRVVLGSDGLLYWSVAQSGPNVGGAQDPTTDASQTYWSAFKIPLAASSENSDLAASTKWVRNWYSSILLPTTMYLDATNGDDSNNGFSSTTAKKTFASIEQEIGSRYYLRPDIITVRCAAGTYSDSPSGVAGVTINYRFSSGAKLTSNISVTMGKTIYLSGKLVTSNRVSAGTEGSIFLGSTSEFLDIEFNNITDAFCFHADSGYISRTYISPSVNVIFSGTCAVTAVLSVTNGGISRWSKTTGTSTAWTNSGTLTGKRYDVSACSVVAGIGGNNVIPGSSAGTVDSTSFFS